MKQIARNLIDDEDGFLNDSRLLLMDHDTKFSAAFRHTLSLGGVHALRLPPKSPNLNAYVERFMRSLKEECLGRMAFFGEDALRNAIREYLEHYSRSLSSWAGNRWSCSRESVVSWRVRLRGTTGRLLRGSPDSPQCSLATQTKRACRHSENHLTENSDPFEFLDHTGLRVGGVKQERLHAQQQAEKIPDQAA